MAQIIKKESFERTQSLGERLDHLAHEAKLNTSLSTGKIVSRHAPDLQREVDRILADARARAETLEHDARRLLDDVEQMVDTRRQEGYDDGYQEGLAELTERMTAMSRLESHFLEDAEPKVLRLVYDIAERVIQKELTISKETIVAMVREALRETTGTQLIVRVHPSDYADLKTRERDLLQALDGVSTLSVREDERVAVGGCVIESEIGTIDAQLATQLLAMRRALQIEAV